MSTFTVVKESVSYNHRIYQRGETLEASDEDMEGLLQAGYVEAAKASRGSKKSRGPASRRRIEGFLLWQFRSSPRAERKSGQAPSFTSYPRRLSPPAPGFLFT